MPQGQDVRARYLFAPEQAREEEIKGRHRKVVVKYIASRSVVVQMFGPARGGLGDEFRHLKLGWKIRDSFSVIASFWNGGGFGRSSINNLIIIPTCRWV